MAVYEQLPGDLSLRFRRGDQISTEVDFNPISLTGYTVAATITSLVSGATIGPITTTMVDAEAGRVNVSLTNAQSSEFAPGTYRWEMTTTDGVARRTYLMGFVEVVP